MTNKLITPVLSICFLFVATILVADNHWRFENNKHYRTLSIAENLSIAEEKIEVLEIFAYS